MFSNKAKFIRFAGISALVSCLASSFSFAHKEDLRMGTYLYAGNQNDKSFDVNDVDELIDECANENNDIQLNDGDEYKKSDAYSAEGDLEENLNEIDEEVENTHTKESDTLQDSIYLDKDGSEDSSKEQKFIYLKNDDENENIYAESNQSANKEKMYSNAVKYGSVSSEDYLKKKKDDSFAGNSGKDSVKDSSEKSGANRKIWGDVALLVSAGVAFFVLVEKLIKLQPSL